MSGLGDDDLSVGGAHMRQPANCSGGRVNNWREPGNVDLSPTGNSVPQWIGTATFAAPRARGPQQHAADSCDPVRGSDPTPDGQQGNIETTRFRHRQRRHRGVDIGIPGEGQSPNSGDNEAERLARGPNGGRSPSWSAWTAVMSRPCTPRFRPARSQRRREVSARSQIPARARRNNDWRRAVLPMTANHSDRDAGARSAQRRSPATFVAVGQEQHAAETCTETAGPDR